MNHQKACYNLGVMYLEGDFLAINKTKAKEYFEKSCNLGYSNACKELGKL
jgi:TPR repeat protein